MATGPGGKLCADGAPGEALATIAGRRVGTARVREILAAIEVADAALAAHERRRVA